MLSCVHLLRYKLEHLTVVVLHVEGKGASRAEINAKSLQRELSISFSLEIHLKISKQ